MRPTGRHKRALCHAWTATALVLAFFCACKGKSPDSSRPWVVVLGERETHTSAARLAERLAKESPALEGSSVFSFEASGALRHWVISPPFASETEAQMLKSKLVETRPARLEVASVGDLKMVAKPETEAQPPESSEEVTGLLALLPAPGKDQLRAFLVRSAEASGGAVPVSFRPLGPHSWAKALDGLGWKGTAEALYTSGQDGSKGTLRLFIGQTSDPQALKKFYNFLLAHVRSEEEATAKPEEPPPLEPPKVKVKGKQPHPKKTPKKTPKKAPAAVVAKPEKPAPLPEIAEPPPPKTLPLPWGVAEVHQVERVTFVPAGLGREKQTLYTAYLAWTPGNQAVFLALFDDAELADRLLPPGSLVDPCGLVCVPALKKLWAVLPEVAGGGDHLAAVGMERFGAWAPHSKVQDVLAKEVGNREVLLAGYRSGKTGWSLCLLDLDSIEVAQQLFERSFVVPRRDTIQRLLQGRTKVKYDLGINLREVRDIQAWYFLGALQGTSQELYFQKDRQLFLLQSPVPSAGGFTADDLASRAELLPIWKKDH